MSYFFKNGLALNLIIPYFDFSNNSQINSLKKIV